MKSYVDSLPSALDLVEFLNTNATLYKPAVFLDYDGTLTPIVDDPAKALLDPKVKEKIDELSKLCLVGIISGRDRADVEGKVGLPSLVYAGSHGYDISGPDITMAHPKGVECLPSMDEAEKELAECLKDVKGARVERKKFAIAVHYRHVASEEVSTVLALVDKVLKKYACLKPGPGKMIMELRPDFEWHKGKALWFLMEQVANQDNIFPIYLGDDMTDEDAFVTLEERGAGVMVGDHGNESSATYRLNDTEEVYSFLSELVELLKSNSLYQ
ncbi:MAG: trehalose-phosphatase [Cytophagaceae bacterium]